MRTLLLGASGFLGQEVLRRMSGKSLTILTTKSLVITTPEIRVIHGHLESSPVLEMIKEQAFDRIVDCSWIGLPQRTLVNNRANLNQKRLLIEASVKGKVQELNFMGTGLEYGSVTGKVSEKVVGKRVDNFGKIKIEILKLIQNSGIRYRWFRLFYLLGSNQHKESLIKTAFGMYLKGRNFVPQNPNATFDYVTIEDAATAIIKSLQIDSCRGVINVGSESLCSVNDIVNSIREYFHLNPIYEMPSPGLYADMSKLRNATGWSPIFDKKKSVFAILQELERQL